MKVWDRNIEVAGVSFRIDAAVLFASGNDQFLSLEPEPNNPQDRNAIKVIGHCESSGKPKATHVGYVPKDIAKAIVNGDISGAFLARLRNIWWGGFKQDVIYIRFDLLVQKPPKPPPKFRKK